MNDGNASRPERPNRQQGNEAGDATTRKELSEINQPKLSLTDLMPGGHKAAKEKTGLETGAFAQHKGISDKVAGKEHGLSSSLAVLFGMALLRELDTGLNASRPSQFKWSPTTAGSNFPDLPQAFGRKFFQPKKVDVKRHDEIIDKESKEKAWQAIMAKKLDQSKGTLTPPTGEKHVLVEDSETKSEEPAEEADIELEVNKIYNEKDYLEEIKLATEISLGIEESQTKGREMFKNLEKVHPQDTSATQSHGPTSSLSRKRLRDCINNLSKGKVIVVGDLLIDELLEGRPERISREAPVLILEHVETELVLGGAANTAHNVASLGGSCHAIGVCGKDEYAMKLALLLDKYGISHGLVQDPSRPTTVKTRILSKAHAIRQQLLRLDRISHATIDSAVESLLVERLNQVAANYQAIVLSDYKAGIMSKGLIDGCLKLAAKHNLICVVDAQEAFERFQGATLLTPNQPDAEQALGFSFDTPEKLNLAGKELMILTGAKAILLTRGPEGMVLFQSGKLPYYLPVFNRSDVFDVTGAGDTVVATMSLALVTGASLEEATALGNLAAGIVVRKPGTAVTTQQELINNLEIITMAEQ